MFEILIDSLVRHTICWDLFLHKFDINLLFNVNFAIFYIYIRAGVSPILFFLFYRVSAF